MMKRPCKLNFDDISMKRKINFKRLESVGMLKFDEKSFFNLFLSFTPYWDYEPTKISYTSETFINSSTMDRIQLKPLLLREVY